MNLIIKTMIILINSRLSQVKVIYLNSSITIYNIVLTCTSKIK